MILLQILCSIIIFVSAALSIKVMRWQLRYARTIMSESIDKAEQNLLADIERVGISELGQTEPGRKLLAMIARNPTLNIGDDYDQR